MSNRAKKAKVEEEKNDIFIVEKVLNRRVGKAGREEFLIQWQGFPESDCSWEPRENLQCIDMLEQFEKEFAKRDKPVTRRRQRSPELDQSTASAEEEPNPNDKFGLNGRQLKCIIGMTRATGELYFLCKFSDDSARLLPAKEVNSRYASHVIKFYESKVTIEERTIDDI